MDVGMRLWKGVVGGRVGEMAGLKGLDHWSLRGGRRTDVSLALYAHVYIDEQKLHAQKYSIYIYISRRMGRIISFSLVKFIL